VCVVGCEGLAVDPSGRRCEWGAHTIEEGDLLSVDGDHGDIYRGEVEVSRDRATELLQTFAEWRATEGAGLGQTA
jgi:pyruvate,orthophosphate dikinase